MPDHPTLRRGALIAGLALPAVVLLIGGLSRRWVGDDGFINVRVAQQLLAGNGLVYNVGERVEAITSPAWVAVLSLAGALGMRLDDAAWSLSLLAAVAGLVASGLAAPKLWSSGVLQRGWPCRAPGCSATPACRRPGMMRPPVSRMGSGWSRLRLGDRGRPGHEKAFCATWSNRFHSTSSACPTIRTGRASGSGTSRVTAEPIATARRRPPLARRGP
jgi:hypothetical protein